MGKLVEDKGYISGACLCTFISTLTFLFFVDIKLPWRGDLWQPSFSEVSAFRQIREVR